jgi:hypothetical protein
LLTSLVPEGTCVRGPDARDAALDVSGVHVFFELAGALPELLLPTCHLKQLRSQPLGLRFNRGEILSVRNYGGAECE